MNPAAVAATSKPPTATSRGRFPNHGPPVLNRALLGGGIGSLAPRSMWDSAPRLGLPAPRLAGRLRKFLRKAVPARHWGRALPRQDRAWATENWGRTSCNVAADLRSPRRRLRVPPAHHQET